MQLRNRRPKKRQLTLDDARHPMGHGGWRPGAGRPRGRTTVSHDARPEFPGRYPIHITMRVGPDAPSISSEWLMRVIRRAIRDAHKDTFHIVEFNVLNNHLHVLGEASGKVGLARGVQGFTVRLARRLNRALGRRGKMFTPRYHARILKTPTEVRNALRYVLLNRKHHAAERYFHSTWIDTCSSAPWFTGWSTPVRRTACNEELIVMPAPNVPAETWLLKVGWRRLGLLDIDDRPAGSRRK